MAVQFRISMTSTSGRLWSRIGMLISPRHPIIMPLMQYRFSAGFPWFDRLLTFMMSIQNCTVIRNMRTR